MPTDWREMLKAKTPKAIETLVNVMESKTASPTARVAAAVALMDRAWGKPHQSISAEMSERHPFNDVLDMSHEERRQMMIEEFSRGRRLELETKAQTGASADGGAVEVTGAHAEA